MRFYAVTELSLDSMESYALCPRMHMPNFLDSTDYNEISCYCLIYFNPKIMPHDPLNT